MEQFLQLIYTYPEGFGILAMLLFFTYDASRTLKIMIVAAVSAIAFYYFTSMHGVSVMILIAGILLAIVDYMRKTRFI